MPMSLADAGAVGDDGLVPKLPSPGPHTLSTSAPIRDLMGITGYSVRAMAELLGLRAHDAVTVALNGGANIRLSTLLRYAAALGYEVEIAVRKRDSDG